MSESLQAANLVIGKAGKGERFSVKHWGLTFKFQVRPITTEQIILIGRESAKMKDIPPDAELFPGMLEHAKNLRYAANSVAIAVLSSNWKRRLFKRLVSGMIRKAPLEDVFTLYLMINKQSNPVFFLSYYGIGDGVKQDDDPKAKGGDSWFGRIAMIKTKLMLSEKEIMKMPWVVLNLMMQDFPWYQYKDDDKPIIVTDPQAAADMMAKFSNRL